MNHKRKMRRMSNEHVCIMESLNGGKVSLWKDLLCAGMQDDVL